MSKFLLIDGNSILNRGYYGLPLLKNKDGIYTNAILGFMNILFKTMDDLCPDYLLVTFDLKAPTFRHKMYPEYKGTRKPMPEEFKMQLPIIREVLTSMNVKIAEMEGYEADDILGTVSKRFSSEAMEVYILSGDRDLLQIADKHITISIPKTVGGKTETFNYKPEDVINEYGVTPIEFIEVKALQGDSSDNIPGVPKIGPKTATELISKYKTLENLYEHVDEITKKSVHENLVNNKDMAFFSRTLSRIEINAPIEINLEDCKNTGLLNDKSTEVLRKYELKSVLNKLEAGFKGEETVKPTDDISYKIISDFYEATETLEKLSKVSKIGIYGDGDQGLALSFSEAENYYIEFSGFITKDYVAGLIKSNIGDKKVYTIDIKKSYDLLGDYREGFHDAEILAYLLDPLKGEYSAVHIGERYLNKYPGEEKEILKDRVKYGVIAARNALLVTEDLLSRLDKEGMGNLYKEIEMPLSYVLYSMEKEGILVNREGLRTFSETLSEGITKLEEKIYDIAGQKFNINSPKQLGEILFDKLNLPAGKKRSTSADILEKLAGDYPIVKDILDYRQLSKLKSTYAEGLQTYIMEDGRIHTHFNQTITATGRISSTEPNLQNIPIRTELGRELRKVFYPKEGFVFLDADYSQIELRLMAHMSGDESLIEAYKENKDIHRATASKVFKKPMDQVTDLDRRNAKAVNFGIIYGISSYGLSEDLSISMKEAKAYMDEYFLTYPKVKNFMDALVSDSKEAGYSKTLYGRIRPIPELKDANFMRRSFGERVAMNAPIQGTAADIMKIAMINIHKRLRAENLESKLLVQVHDEVLVETKESEIDTVKNIIREEMTGAANLSVPLEIDMHEGMTWYEAK